MKKIAFIFLLFPAIAFGDSKLTDLSEDTSPSTEDLVYTVDDPGGTPASKKVTVGNLLNSATNFQILDATLTDLANAPLTEDNSVAVAAVAAGTLPTDVMASSVALSGFFSADSVRSNLGLAIGSNVQAYDADLDDLADGSLTGSKVGSGVPAANIASGDLGSSVKASSFPATGVTAGSYTNTNLTVDAQGRITVASNGSAGGGGGASTLEVFSNVDAVRSSPTASISVGGGLTSSVSGSTFSFAVNWSSGISRSDVIAGYQPLDATLTDLAAAPLGEADSISVGAIAAGILPSDVQASSGAVGAISAVSGLTGALAAANFPALTGDVTTSAGSLATTVADNAVDGTDIALGSDAQGDVMYYDGTNWVRLAAGNSGEKLETRGAGQNPVWDTDETSVGGGDNLGNHVATMTITAGFGISATTVAVTDDAYGAGWNGSTFVPTRNAVYDKIETMPQTAGDHLTLTGTDLDVDDDFLLNTGDIGTGAYDFGGATSVEIPNGTNPTVDATGETALDTTDGAIVVFDGNNTRVVAHATMTHVISISSGTGWDSLAIPVFTAPNDMAITITKVMVETMPVSSTVTFSLQERAFGSMNTAGTDVFTVVYSTGNGVGTTITGFANSSIAANASLMFVTGANASAGSPSWFKATIYYLKERE